jgi:hypothetical protein
MTIKFSLFTILNFNYTLSLHTNFYLFYLQSETNIIKAQRYDTRE